MICRYVHQESGLNSKGVVRNSLCLLLIEDIGHKILASVCTLLNTSM